MCPIRENWDGLESHMRVIERCQHEAGVTARSIMRLFGSQSAQFSRIGDFSMKNLHIGRPFFMRPGERLAQTLRARVGVLLANAHGTASSCHVGVANAGPTSPQSGPSPTPGQ